MIKCLIIDDIQSVRNLLKLMISSNFSEDDVTVVGEAFNVSTGVDLINKSKFDLLFLDVKLGELNGFDLLNIVGNKKFDVIFITSYKTTFAIDAIRSRGTVDYLEKPFTDQDLIAAIERYKYRIAERASEIDAIKKEHLLKKKEFITITGSGERFNVSKILFCRAAGSYTEICFDPDEKNKKLCSNNLTFYEKELREQGYFFRVHRAYLVNLRKIYRVAENKRYLILNNKSNTEIPIGKKRTKEFQLALNTI